MDIDLKESHEKRYLEEKAFLSDKSEVFFCNIFFGGQIKKYIPLFLASVQIKVQIKFSYNIKAPLAPNLANSFRFPLVNPAIN